MLLPKEPIQKSSFATAEEPCNDSYWDLCILDSLTPLIIRELLRSVTSICCFDALENLIGPTSPTSLK
jgi:hypothetical protein